MGCVIVAVGAGGAVGGWMMVTMVADETHPEVLCTVTLYAPEAMPTNTVAVS